MVDGPPNRQAPARPVTIIRHDNKPEPAMQASCDLCARVRPRVLMVRGERARLIVCTGCARRLAAKADG